MNGQTSDSANTPREVAVALGGGGVRGLAHIPLLERVEHAGLKVHSVAGTSMGAIIGALIASGLSASEIREGIHRHIIRSSDGVKEILDKKRELMVWLKAVGPSWHRSGLLSADGFLSFLLDEVQAETFEELALPLKVVATDFLTGEIQVFESGPLLPALQASMSIPGVFVPLEIDGTLLVDGGASLNLPYTLLMEEEVPVLAFDVAPTRTREELRKPTMVDATVGMFDILVDQVTDLHLKQNPPDLYHRPTLTGIKVMEFDKIEEVFEQAEQSLPELDEKLQLLE